MLLRRLPLEVVWPRLKFLEKKKSLKEGKTEEAKRRKANRRWSHTSPWWRKPYQTVWPEPGKHVVGSPPGERAMLTPSQPNRTAQSRVLRAKKGGDIAAAPQVLQVNIIPQAALGLSLLGKQCQLVINGLRKLGLVLGVDRVELGGLVGIAKAGERGPLR